MNYLSSNPYNSLGQAHNTGLDYVIAHIPANPTPTDWLNATTNYMLTQVYPPVSAPLVAYSPINIIEIQSLVATSFNGELSAEKYICQGKFTQKQLDILLPLLNPDPTIDNANLPALYLSAGYSILAANLPDDQKQILLLAAAVGNYSTTYWNAQLDNQSSPWQPYLGNAENMPKWVAGDIAGAIGGAIGGAIVGTLTTGVGGLIGGIAGAIGGSIGLSISVALTS